LVLGARRTARLLLLLLLLLFCLAGLQQQGPHHCAQAARYAVVNMLYEVRP
jgi:hypothetical protein